MKQLRGFTIFIFMILSLFILITNAPYSEAASIGVQVSNGTDDAEERVSDGRVRLTSSDLELTYDGRQQLVGMRFNNVQIPQGANVDYATIEFEVDEPRTGDLGFSISGEYVGDAGAFSSNKFDISSRAFTIAKVVFDPVPEGDWSTKNKKVRLPDISSIVQEIVNGLDWASSNSMVIIIHEGKTNNRRTMESYNGESANAPILIVDYTAIPINDTTPPNITSISHSPLNPTSNDPVSFDVTASDASGIFSIELFVDTFLVKTCFTSSCNFIDGPYVAGTNISYNAFVTDNSPNRNSVQSAIKSFVVAGGGGGGGGSDTIPPVVTMTSPTEGTTISGTSALTADASDNVTVERVQFRLDSEHRCSADTSAPYACNLDTTLESDGPVTFTAVATDTSGNQTISDPVTVTIDNSGGPPPPPPPPASGTIRVPEDYATIQGGVNAAGDGDLVLVGPGTYSGGINISGKSITLASHYHTTLDPSFIDQTTIDGGSPAISVAATATGTVIKGLRFTRGSKSIQFFSHGSSIENHFDNTGSDAISFERVGGIAIGNVCFSPSDECIDVDHPESDVLIENNVMDFSGDDGIEIRNGNYSGALVTITIRDNIITGSGEDGIQIIDYSANSDRMFIIERNLIRNSTDVGLGLMDNGETREDFRAASVPERIHVFSNTFDSNTYGITGGDNLVALNNLFVNSAILGMKGVDGGSIAAYNLFWNNGVDDEQSNLDLGTTVFADPLLDIDSRLLLGSPAIDAGTAFFEWQGQFVLDLPDSAYVGIAPDLGAFENGE